MENIKPKVVVVGAGSLFFGRQIIWAFNQLEGLKGGILSLVDTDPAALEKMTQFGRLCVKESGCGTVMEGHADYRAALPGADFVILSFSTRNTHYRRIDTTISAKYGIRMCSSDTIGPGGVFRTLRDFPKILEVAHAVEELCPNAWLINYVNPSAVMGIGLMRHSKAKTFALCDTHHLPGKKYQYLDLLGIDRSELPKVDIQIAGVNHFTWMLKAEYQGEDLLPRLTEAFRETSRNEQDAGYSKGRYNSTITTQLADLFGVLPTCTGHTKEYLPYYQGRTALSEPAGILSLFNCDERAERKATMWTEIDAYLSGEKSIADFFTSGRADHAADIINTMCVEDGRTYYINRANTDCVEGGGRAVPNLEDDAFLELECRLDRNGPRPLPVVPFPRGVSGLQNTILDTHELTIEAIIKQDRELLVRALAIDPLVNSIATAEAVIDDLYEAQKEALPAWVNCKTSRKAAGAVAAGAVTPQLY